MRLFLYVTSILLLSASVTGCASKSPAGCKLPPGVIQNPNRPDPEAIKARKPWLIDPQTGGGPSRYGGKR